MDVQTNTHGFRDFQRAKTEECALRILFLGDSFVFGYGLGIEKRLDTALRTLAKKNKIAVDTINWGVPGWGTRQEALYAANHLTGKKINAVVLLFCNNDPANDRGVGLPTLPDIESPLYPLKTGLRRYSHLYRLLLKLRANSKSARTDGAGDSDNSVYDITMKDWENTKKYIHELGCSIRRVNPEAPLLVLAASPDDNSIRDHLSTIAMKQDGTFYIDLEPFIVDIAVEDRQMPWDGHWSPAVHNGAASAIFHWLRKEVL